MTVHSTRPLVVARAIRALADGFASVLLARYLRHLGFSGFEIGVIVTATLVGSAALTLLAGLRLTRFGPRSVLLWSCALMAVTGVGFGTFTRFLPLVVVGFIGTLNPSVADVSLFLPTEQAVLADLTDVADRPQRFAVYNLAASSCCVPPSHRWTSRPARRSSCAWSSPTSGPRPPASPTCLAAWPPL